jgi:methanogenic corrinoid protein MtbC1
MPRPKRTPGGHRQYSQRDIDTLKWLVARQQEGMSISHATELWRVMNDESQDSAVQEEPVVITKPQKPVFPRSSTEVAKLREEWVTACLAFDRVEAENVLARAFALFPPDIVVVQLLQLGLSEIGQLWYQGQVSVQQEHFASAMSVQRLEILIAATPPPSRPERIVIASAEDDFHVFSPLLFTFLLRRRGWDVLYLGANMPVASLAEMVAEVKPHLLIVSAQTLSTATSLLDLTAALEGHETTIAYGGVIFNVMPQLQDRIPAQYLGPTIEGAVSVAERLIQQPAPEKTVAACGSSFTQALQQFRQRRYLIESHIWRIYSEAGKTTSRLDALNHEFGDIIIAALIFADNGIFSPEMEWIHYLMSSYKLSEAEAMEYVAAYYQAAKTHLTGPAEMVCDWLLKLQDG